MPKSRRRPGQRPAADRSPPRRPQGRPQAAAGVADAPAQPAQWLLLVHQVPPKPDYLRVKVGRRLQRVGAIAIKNSVYALPPGPATREDFLWIAREIEEAGGEAFVSEASLLSDGLTDADVRSRFDAARDAAFATLLADARVLLQRIRKTRSTTRTDAPSLREAERELAKLRRRHEREHMIDFFGCANGVRAAGVLHDIDAELNKARRRPVGRAPARASGSVWVTRRDVHVDRIACAWLITRFIDPRAQFRFVDEMRYTHAPPELRFDMTEGEYTHEGEACSFETLVRAFGLKDSALVAIGEIVHDVDCKDAKFERDEAPGVARVIAGIASQHPADEDRIRAGESVFDSLYAAFSGARGTRRSLPATRRP